MSVAKAGRLAQATSPYLRAHAHNPVEWYPWGDEALARARELDRPILLSIGYSACHWCHVMAHESFEDAATAELMNTLFINIKVDREERPDLDRLYQTAHQLIAQRPGGWPLTMFLTPGELTPFYGGTYFPPSPRAGLPAFREVLQGIAAFYRERPEEVREQGRAVAAVFPRLEPEAPAEDVVLDAGPLEAARQALAERFDSEFGGFGGAPKFPHPEQINRLLRHWREGAAGEQPDVQALYMATMTLSRMADGGLLDQLAGGFFRYSVDTQWRVPHFEKMLCDNATLLPLYAQAWRISGDESYRRVASLTADWVIDEMQLAHGGYCTALDADSEGGEGRYYLWTREQVERLLSADEFAVLAPFMGLDEAPSVDGHWHLHARGDLKALGRQLNLPASTVESRLNQARAVLLAARSTRPRITRDDKILTGWNALMISGMAVSARSLSDPRLAQSAQQAMAFLRAELWHDGRLFAVHSRGHRTQLAWLDDHAALIDAALKLLELAWDSDMLGFAIELAEAMLAQFEDRTRGGFYFIGNDHEQLIHRSRPFADEATPAGNGMAAFALQRLGLLLGETRYLEVAERTLRAAWTAMCEYPVAHCTMLDALEEHLRPPDLVIIRGEGLEADALVEVATAVYSPRRMVLRIPSAVADLPAALALKRPMESAIAYLCIGTRCSAPLSTPAALAAALSESSEA
ncbi:MAG: thioredoxin domain-containing protein [Gammaproteobacteria bacterium]|nr:thioredoxin domain-containing protein [Gammaproteobacteria bacterium]